MFSGGQTQGIGGAGLTPEQQKIWDSLSPAERQKLANMTPEDLQQAQSEMMQQFLDSYYGMHCDPPVDEVEGEAETATSIEPGKSCEASNFFYETHGADFFKASDGWRCNKLTENKGYSCFLPKDKQAGAEEVGKSEETEEQSGFARIWQAGRNMIKSAPLIGEWWDAQIEFGIVAIDVLFGDDEDEAAEEASEAEGSKEAPLEEVGKTPASVKAGESKEAGEVKEGSPKSQKYPGKLAVEVGPADFVKRSEVREDLKIVFPDLDEDVLDHMVDYAVEKAKEYADADQRVIWAIKDFQTIFNIHQLEKSGNKVLPSVERPDTVAKVLDIKSDKLVKEIGPSGKSKSIGGGKKAPGGAQKPGGTGKGGKKKPKDTGTSKTKNAGR